MQRQSERQSSHLEQAIALLINTQASFVSQLVETRRENEKTIKEIRKDFSQIQQDFIQIKAMLLRHERILSELPEAIRQKSVFSPPEATSL